METNRENSGNGCAIVIAGQAGQGIQTIEALLVRGFLQEGYHVFSSQEFMSRIRGGTNSTLLRVASRPVRAWSDRIDICAAFDAKAVIHLERRLTDESFVLADAATDASNPRRISVPLGKLATDAGGRILVNIVAAGLLWGVLGCREETLENVVRRHFGDKETGVIAKNLEAVRSGMEWGRELRNSGRVSPVVPPPGPCRRDLRLTGSDAVSLGAIAGGCNFVSAYPMSPSTGVFTFLAQHGRDSGILVEQAEDEIGAANMVIGAWYAGARGLVPTSGGGFALMTEALSLAGMSETPMVILLAQRPGPATGLPTRTEQGDFNLALYSGHGEFPRALLAPGNAEQAYELTRRAFDLADSCQVPAIVLTDQYLMDSGFDVENLLLPDRPVEATVVRTGPGYERYAFTESGVSPRGIPGWGEGLVGADSHEHDENAHITEKPDLRVSMVQKRLGKLKHLTEQALSPEWIGPRDAASLLVCWGSTLEIVREALIELSRDDLAALHFAQLHPLPESARELLRRADRHILMEGNATGQFGAFLSQLWGIEWRHRILKYNGFQFSVEEVRDALRQIMGQEERR